MSHDVLKFWLFPFVYYGLSVSYSCFNIYALGDYEPKDGQWGSFKIYLALFGFMTFLASLSYGIGLACLKTAPQQLPRPRLALITVLSALLSWAVLLTFLIVEPDIKLTLFLLLWFGCICIVPALIVVSLIKLHQSCFAALPSTQR
jgi:hypothetical protein